MIYGRWGQPVTIRRMGTLDDVRDLDSREPDSTDEEAVSAGSYVVVRGEDQKDRLYHIAYLRADGGSKEIMDAIEAKEASA